MKKQILVACLYTVVTAAALGILYPLAVTVVAQFAFANNANGQLITQNGVVIGSHLIGQPFTGAGFFHSRPSAAGAGYDASSSSGSNLAPTNKAFVDHIHTSAAAESTGAPVPIDLVTASASGLDPDISPAAALYQVPRVARERYLSDDKVRSLVITHITPRQLGVLGEPRVNVLELNLALEQLASEAPVTRR